MFGRELIFVLLFVTVKSAGFDLVGRAHRKHDVLSSDGPSVHEQHGAINWLKELGFSGSRGRRRTHFSIGNTGDTMTSLIHSIWKLETLWTPFGCFYGPIIILLINKNDTIHVW